MRKDIEIFPVYDEEPDDMLDEILDEFEKKFISEEMKVELEPDPFSKNSPVSEGLKKRVRDLESHIRMIESSYF
jgi:hypothetical protein